MAMGNKIASQRILAFDLLRGYFLCVILVDHLYRFPGFFDIFSGQGKLWVSAAEGFFLISGALVGYIYRDSIRTAFWRSAKKIWKRSAVLYFWAVSLTLFFTVWANQMPSLKIKQDWLPLSDPMRLLSETLGLRYTYGWADFLSYYAVFMVFAPLILFFLSRKKWWVVLLVSLGIWLQRQSNFYYSWQLLFVIGMIAGYFLPHLESTFQLLSVKRRKVLTYGAYALSLITLAISAFFVFGIKDLLDAHFHHPYLPQALYAFLTHLQNWHNELLYTTFDKGKLGEGRVLLALLWFATLYGYVRRHEERINKLTRGFFKTLGANSLLAYGLHATLLFPINLILPSYTPFWQNLLITFTLLLVLYLLVLLVEAVKKKIYFAAK